MEKRSLSGRIRWPDGTPFRRGRISILAEGWDYEEGVELDDRGAFTLDDPPEGRFGISGWLPAQSECRAFIGRWVVEAGPGDLDLTIDRSIGRSFVVEISDPDGAPAAAGRVAIEHLGNHFERAALEFEDGVAAFNVWDPFGRVLVDVTDARSAGGVPLGATLAGPFDVSGGRVEVRPPEARTLRGRVLDPRGAGVGGVSARAAPVPPIPSRVRHDAEHARAETDAEGRFEIPGLGAARYVVRLFAPDAFAAVKPRLEPADGAPLEVRLAEPHVADVVVVDPDGSPVEGALVDVSTLFEAGVPRSPTGADGRVHLRRLDPAAEPVLQVEPPDSRADLGPARFTAWIPGDTRVSLPARGGRTGEPDGDAVLRVAVPGWPEAACGQARLWSEGQPFFVRNLADVPEGGLEFEGLRAAETYRLILVGVGDGLVADASGLVPGDVEVALEPGLSIAGRVDVPDFVHGAEVAASRGPIRVEGDLWPDGRFEVRGLTEGPWDLDVTLHVPGQTWEGRGDAEAGGPEVVVPLVRTR